MSAENYPTGMSRYDDDDRSPEYIDDDTTEEQREEALVNRWEHDHE